MAPGMHAPRAPAVREVLHYDWTRRFFAHLPSDPSWEEHLDEPYCHNGTSLDLLMAQPDGLAGSILAAKNPDPRPGRPRLLLWHGPRRIRQETFYGLFGPRFQRIEAASFRLLLDRTNHFLILRPESDPTYVFPLSAFARFGATVGALEAILDAKVVVATEHLYARGGHVPSLRVYAAYDGARYGHSTRKLFYDRQGNPVPVELVARDVLRRLGYEAVPPGLFHRLFYAVTNRPASDFRADAWPHGFLRARDSPLAAVARLRDCIDGLREAGLFPGLVAALEALSRRGPWRDFALPQGALPLVARYLTRRRLESFLETLGGPRLLGVFHGILRGHDVVSADWFAYSEATGRAFPCEVKSSGDHLQPSQKSSILYCQRTGILDYRLLELLHNAFPGPGNGEKDGQATNPTAKAIPAGEARPQGHPNPAGPVAGA